MVRFRRALRVGLLLILSHGARFDWTFLGPFGDLRNRRQFTYHSSSQMFFLIKPHFFIYGESSEVLFPSTVNTTILARFYNACKTL